MQKSRNIVICRIFFDDTAGKSFSEKASFQEYIRETPAEQAEIMKDYLMNLDAEKLLNEVKK